ncbi:MAG: hypothetical protein NVSMB14_08290 [Isosphaeraceae bacterium]
MTQYGTSVKRLTPTLPHGNAPMRVKYDSREVAGAGLLALFLVFASASTLLAADEPSPPKGQLVIVGGGKFDVGLRKRTLELAGGPKAHVVLIPNASRDKSAWPIMVQRWVDAGAENVVVVDSTHPAKAVETVQSADLIWIRGGSQTLFMDSLQGTGVPEAIRTRFQQGAIIAGTSAGAAVMSDLMIAGWTRNADQRTLRTAHGLGLWPETIVDQHFLRRARTDRLKGIVLQHPELVGIGIDEATAVLVNGREFEVMGASKVIVLDARKGNAKSKSRDQHSLKAAATAREKTAREVSAIASDSSKTPPQPRAEPADKAKTESSSEKNEIAEQAAPDIETFVLEPGMRYSLDKGILSTAHVAAHH